MKKVIKTSKRKLQLETPARKREKWRIEFTFENFSSTHSWLKGKALKVSGK